LKLLAKLSFITLLLVQEVSANESRIEDDIDGKIKEKKEIRTLLHDQQKEWEDAHKLKVIFSFMGVSQYDTITETKATGDRIDFLIHYTLDEHFSFGMLLEQQWKIGENGSSSFAKEIGSINKLSAGFSDTGAFVRELWGEYKENAFLVRAGIINSNSFVDRSFYSSYANFFMSHASSSHSYGQVPMSSLGIGLKYTQPDYYINTVFSDATGRLQDAVHDIREEDLDPYNGFEVGYTPDKDIYFVNVWRKKNKKGEISYGGYLSLNKYIDAQNKVFAKLGTSRNSKTRNRFSFGWGHDDLFSNKDLFLTAFASSQDPKTDKYQNNYELTYIYKLDYGMKLSADLQVIQDPINTGEDWAVIPGIRFKVVF